MKNYLLVLVIAVVVLFSGRYVLAAAESCCAKAPCVCAVEKCCVDKKCACKGSCCAKAKCQCVDNKCSSECNCQKQ